jgi:hypothetical protein
VYGDEGRVVAVKFRGRSRSERRRRRRGRIGRAVEEQSWEDKEG